VPALLRSVWEEPRPAGAPGRVWRDWVLVGALIPAAVIEGILRPDLPWRVLSVAVTAALVPTLLWRRTRPLAMVAVGFGICGLALLVTRGQFAMDTSAYLLLLPYCLYRWGSGREAVAGSGIVLANVVLSVLVGNISRTDAVGAFIVLFAVIALGSALRYRARARQREVDQVKLLERERLARDLHDTVAHHVSAMAIRAQAGLATVASNPGAAAEALRVIESEASRALAEMRAMVRVLRRDEPADRAPAPRVVDLAGLADGTRSGPAVEVELLGDIEHLPPPVGTAVFRIAQESVTNARRHARHATRVRVRVAVDGATVRLRVRDDGEPVTARPGGAPGYGIAGMVERAGLLGGVCEAGPDPDGGWTVSAVLPRDGSPA
jgi:signal transduction histidine kinase